MHSLTYSAKAEVITSGEVNQTPLIRKAYRQARVLHWISMILSRGCKWSYK